MQQKNQGRQYLTQQGHIHQSQRIFTASEVAEYEYCPLVWWYQQHDPLADADTEELFARMVELEHERGPQATSLPEYQVIEQLLVRRGAFEAGQDQHREHAEAVAELSGMSDAEDEQLAARDALSDETRRMLRRIALLLTIVAGIVIIISLILIVR